MISFSIDNATCMQQDIMDHIIELCTSKDIIYAQRYIQPNQYLIDWHYTLCFTEYVLFVFRNNKCIVPFMRHSILLLGQFLLALKTQCNTNTGNITMIIHYIDLSRGWYADLLPLEMEYSPRLRRHITRHITLGISQYFLNIVSRLSPPTPALTIKSHWHLKWIVEYINIAPNSTTRIQESLKNHFCLRQSNFGDKHQIKSNNWLH